MHVTSDDLPGFLFFGFWFIPHAFLFTFHEMFSTISVCTVKWFLAILSCNFLEQHDNWHVSV
jgi:hypothetical protein